MKVLGITGGIATGKSTVTQMLADFGAPTISADTLARDLLAPGTASTRAVLAAFPSCADPQFDVTIDRRALGRLVFADPSARELLESLTHPAIISTLSSQTKSWRISIEARGAAAEIPLLFEANLGSLVDSVVVVTCSEFVQISRLEARMGIDETEARRLIAAQWPLAEKVARADILIMTDSGLEATRLQVESLWNSL